MAIVRVELMSGPDGWFVRHQEVLDAPHSLDAQHAIHRAVEDFRAAVEEIVNPRTPEEEVQTPPVSPGPVADDRPAGPRARRRKARG